MIHRRIDPRFSILLLLISGGCNCGETGLHNARPKLVVTPLSLDFEEVVKGDVKVLGLEVKNAGTLPLHIKTHDIAPSPTEFALTTPVPEVVESGQKVQVSVAYQPTDLGEDKATLTFTSDDGLPDTIVSLRGVGVESGVAVTTDGDPCGDQEHSISFGSVHPGMTVERGVHVKLLGPVPAKILSAVPEPGSSPEFTIDGASLPKSIGPGEELALTARYAPVDGGMDMGAFIITTDSQATPSIRIPVCGTGIAAALCAHPVPLDVGSGGVGETVHARMKLESCGTEPVTLNAVALSSDMQHMSAPGFRLTSTPTVPATLQPSQTVEVEVTFDAQQPYGDAHAWVQATSTAYGMTQSYFPVIAHVLMPCSLSVTPTEISYRSVNPGMRAQKNALVANNGGVACIVASATVATTGSGHEFSLVMPPTTPITLAAGQSQILEVEFAPTSAGMKEGTLTVVDGGGMPHSIPLHGNPPAPMGCVVDFDPTVINFGLTAIGTTPHRALHIRAVGGDPCNVTAARLIHHDPAFAVNLPLLTTAFPGFGGVDIDVIYSPTMAIQSTDIIEVTYAPFMGMGGGTFQVGVSGGAGEAKICVMPAALNFGNVPPRSSGAQSLMISNCGPVDLNLRGVMLSSGGGPFQISQMPAYPVTLAPGAAATPQLGVTYAPQDAGPHYGLINILSSDTRNPNVRVPLSGNATPGCDKVLQCSPPNVAFGDTALGSHKIVRIVCNNVGALPVTVSSVALSGGSADLSLLGAQTPVTLLPGEAWSFDVSYAPSTGAPVSGGVTIMSDACVAPAPEQITGTGVPRPLPPCQPPTMFSPREQWSWHSSSIEPTFTNVWSTPLVANLNDDNQDGRIDENDIPEVVFISIDKYSLMDPAAAQPGIIRVLSGDSGTEEFSVTATRFVDTTIPAIGDLDGDGKPEIVGFKWKATPPGTGTGGFFGRFTSGTIAALDNQGHLLWESDPYQFPDTVTENASSLSIADLDKDGFAEVIVGRDVFDHTGHLKWRGAGSFGQVSDGIDSVVADIDLDGHPEVLAGGTVYRGDGSIMWSLPNGQEGGVSVGMLDPMDPFPEIVIHTGSSLRVLDHLGVEKWHAPITSMAAATELPTLADFDGDGDTDIAIADGASVNVFRGTGGMLWSAPTSDMTCCVGISAFDFEGDGAYELILHDYGTVYVYRGATGAQLYSAPRPSVTAFEMPVVADIDRDNKGELVVALYDLSGRGGIVAYSNIGDSWVAAPRIWNQQVFHVTNVFESGAIPRVEVPIPMAPRVFRGTSAACR
jgi:ASPM-SPD-2-Hydin domain-containing protein/HYDIN/CFA65/VesB family protein/VCBS repeat protein